MIEDWDDEDAGSSFDCPSCEGFLSEGLMISLNERSQPYFYNSLICNRCDFSALTAVQYQNKLRAQAEKRIL